MKAVIMAAGIGSRLRPYTDDKPKCLVEVAEGTSILDTQLKALAKIDIEEIIIVVGHKGEKIIAYVNEKYPTMNIKFIVNAHYNTTNNMYSFNLTKEFINGSSFISLNADVAIHEDMLNVVLQNEEEKNIILCDKNQFMEESMKVVYDAEKAKITNISKAITKNDAYAVSIDIYYFSKETAEKLYEIVDYILTNRPNDWFEVALAELLAVEPFEPMDINNKSWVEIDNIDDLNLARGLFTHA